MITTTQLSKTAENSINQAQKDDSGSGNQIS
jgi:hypothetical protein